MMQISKVHAHIVNTLLPDAGRALCSTAIGTMENEVLNRTKNTIT
jgi:23S rRNA U2552 (ribose-2'-O)-methylase RlmE/FtsJ